MNSTPHVGDYLREWRQRRRLSQMDLALDAEISTRHLSFLETGRSQPSRDMILHLAERLEVPLRERNTLLAEASQTLLREALPGAERKTYEKAGHNLPWEQPERVAQDVIGFVP